MRIIYLCFFFLLSTPSLAQVEIVFSSPMDFGSLEFAGGSAKGWVSLNKDGYVLIRQGANLRTQSRRARPGRLSAELSNVNKIAVVCEVEQLHHQLVQVNKIRVFIEQLGKQFMCEQPTEVNVAGQSRLDLLITADLYIQGQRDGLLHQDWGVKVRLLPCNEATGVCSLN
jgi:hypothetical protein